MPWRLFPPHGLKALRIDDARQAYKL